MLKNLSLTLCLFIGTLSILMGQNRLNETFYEYHVIQLDSKAEVRNTSTGFFETDFTNPKTGETWILDMAVSNIISDDYQVRMATPNGIVTRLGTSAVPAHGYIKGKPESRVSITYNDDFVYGFIQDEGLYHYIEPLRYYVEGAQADKFVFYSTADLKPTAEKTCATEAHKHGIHDAGKSVKPDDSRVDECYEVEWAIASDFLMFQSYGSVIATENHAIGVANNVQTNYDDEFADELQFIIVEQFIPTTEAEDPWTNSTNAGTLLDDFTDWGPSGFAATHDIGSIWTDRNFNGGTIGVAWLGVVCTGLRYNALEDFTNNANLKRVMVAHEIGHNFDADHDASGSGFIMAPSVNNTTTWSANSINFIDAHIASRWCLDDCASSVSPPTADFSVIGGGGCAPTQVQYISEATGIVDSYEWEFPGGVPAFSTEENPFVTYNEGGTYGATLTVTNSADSDSYTDLFAVDIDGVPNANFSFSVMGATVTFTNLTQGGNTFSWNFGDGNTSSEENPAHTYGADGDYQVTFTAFNDCGADAHIEFVTIATPPVASFEADEPSGCVVHTVNFFSTSSSNAETFMWLFEGGDPETSTEEEPTVTYSEVGTFDVTLVVTNNQGENTSFLQDFITVEEGVEAGFTSTADGSIVTFTNTTTAGTSYEWDFGDGSTSDEENPTHEYDAEGTYTVTLTAEGPCGPSVVTEDIEVTLLPVADFSVGSGTTAGCTPFTVDFVDATSNDPTSWAWTFEGGEPATSTEQNPVVIYNNPGTFDVQLISTNAIGTDTVDYEDYIFVEEGSTIDPSYESDELAVQFTANASNFMSISWDFGDGSTSEETDPAHTYDTEGEYTAIVSVTNFCGTTSTEIAVSVYQFVTADFSQDVTEICEGDMVQYTDLSSDNATGWSWTFEGGEPATSTEQNPSVVYTAPGTYNVSLVATNPLYEDEIVYSELIDVATDLVPAYATTINGLEVVFENETSSSITSVLWDFGDGETSTEMNPTHTYPSEDIYTVSLTVTNACGDYSASLDLNLYTDVTSAFSASEGGCAPHTVTYTDMSSDNATGWSWTFDGGEPSTSTEQNPTVTYSAGGTYEATLVTTNPVSEATSTTTVEISDVPAVSFDYFREELEISFTNTSDSGDSYAWDFGDGGTSNTENPTHTYETEGTYTVTLTVTNECGESTTTQEVIASALPSASFAVSGDSEGCLPFEVSFTDQSSSNVEAWAWTFEGGDPATSTDENPTVTYTEAGVYDVTLVVTAQAGTDEMVSQELIVVNDVPDSDFTYTVTGNEVTLVYEGDDVTDIAWDFGDGRTSMEKDPVIIYDMDGTYTVTMTTMNECGSTTVEQDIVISTVSVEDIEGITFDIFPNPAQHSFTVSTASTDAQLQIFDLHGKLLRSEIVRDGSRVDTDYITNGTYLVQLTDGSKTAYKKLVLIK